MRNPFRIENEAGGTPNDDDQPDDSTKSLSNCSFSFFNVPTNIICIIFEEDSGDKWIKSNEYVVHISFTCCEKFIIYISRSNTVE